MDVAVEEVAGDEQEHVLSTMRQLPIDRGDATKKTPKSRLWKITERAAGAD